MQRLTGICHLVLPLKRVWLRGSHLLINRQLGKKPGYQLYW
jgi:hypothetical protein